MDKLEFYAKNGNPNNGGLGRDALIGITKVGTGKVYSGPYKNGDITGDENSQYNISHTNAKSDQSTPSYGKGTGDGVTPDGEFTAIENYNGGSHEDRFGVVEHLGSGRQAMIAANDAKWGYGPHGLGLQTYKDKAPTITPTGGQVIIV